MKDLAYISGFFSGVGAIGLVCATHYGWGIIGGLAVVILFGMGAAMTFAALKEARG